MVISAPLVILFLVTPSNYWTRYSIYIVALASIGLFYLLERMKQQRKWTLTTHLISNAVKIYLLVLICISLIFTAPHGFIQENTILDSISKTPKDRTIGNYFFTEFKWVDTIPTGSIVAMPRDHHPFIYPLMGRSGKNKIVMLNEQAPSLKELQNQNLDYLFVFRDSSFDQWIKQQQNYCEPFDNTMQKYVVYKVK
jgi:hypothetical protein